MNQSKIHDIVVVEDGSLIHKQVEQRHGLLFMRIKKRHVFVT
ncbi:MAG TPA: hypothetical protein VJB08_00155 [Candidatus Nanoarchaeia archaeon]|nr:hypothetical protein [Candidatus Nanoarchaeia archaeon]